LKALCAVVILLSAFFATSAMAQLPGDFNCNGQVNGVDLTFWVNYLNYIHFPSEDSSTCTWRNGDFNGDGLSCTCADGYQLYAYIRGDFRWMPDNPPLTPELDSIIIGSVSARPGDRISVPLSIYIAEPMTSFEIQVRFDPEYFSMPWMWTRHIDGGGLRAHVRHNSFIMFYRSSQNLPPGRYHLADIELSVSPRVPLDTTITIDPVSGWYFPSGFVNYSYPFYFIQPILKNGEVRVGTSDIDEIDLPVEMGLRNYPNPFNPSTVIFFSLPESDHARLTIYDILGNLVTRLIDRVLPSGKYSVAWDATSFPSGAYFYRLETSAGTQNGKMTLLK